VIEEATVETAIGKISGYNRVLNPFKKQIKVRVKTDNKTVGVLIEDKELKFIQKKYWTGGRVAVGYYSGKWHIGIPHDPLTLTEPVKKDVPVDLFEQEINSVDITALVGKPLKNLDLDAARFKHNIPKKQVQVQDIPEKIIQAQNISEQKIPEKIMPLQNIPGQNIPVQNVPEQIIPDKNISLEDALLEDIEKFSGYIKWVEEYTREGVDDVLEKLELSHLNVNKVNIDPTLDKPVKKMSHAEVHLEEYIELMDYLVTQNDEIMLNQHEIIRLLTKLTSKDEDEAAAGR
jgi:hypothetical protein